MITLPADAVPFFYFGFFSLLLASAVWMSSRTWRTFTDAMRDPVLPPPRVWQPRAFGDLAWKGGFHSYLATPRRKRMAGTIASLATVRDQMAGAPDFRLNRMRTVLKEGSRRPGWLTYAWEADGFIPRRQRFVLRSTEHTVQLDFVQSLPAALCTIMVRQRGVPYTLAVGPGRRLAAQVSYDGKSVGSLRCVAQGVELLDVTGNIVAVWNTAAGGGFAPADEPHLYDALEVQGRWVGEILRPDANTGERFRYHPSAPLLRNVRASQSPQEQVAILAVLAMLVYCLATGRHPG